MTGNDLADIGIGATTDEQLERLARLATDTGCDGVIASPREARAAQPVGAAAADHHAGRDVAGQRPR
ncbi:hypothetical protein ABZZ20_26170 [Streptomyces sp. NPDC006430]|uniref:hypothetical protein n=1 Tax=Streptomyces sp. NPDC006430 TaxID=3154299 RepID=UPI00339DEBDC